MTIRFDSRSTRRWLGVLFCCVLGAAACGGEGTDDREGNRCGPQYADVVRVLDGDTIELSDTTRVRYLLIDAPEISHAAAQAADCFGPEAQRQNESLVSGARVTLAYDTQCHDKYERVLAYVSVDGRMINRILIERGYARVMVIPPNDRWADEFREIESMAKQQGAGLWGQCAAKAGADEP